MKTEFEEERFEKFKVNCLSQKYNNVFAYRFLLFLRNYSQHGFLPVSRKADGRFCFDLDQIINTSHFRFNTKMKESMGKIRNEIITMYNSEPCIAFTQAVDTFTLTVVEIYYCFLKEIEKDVSQYHTDLQKIVREHPELVYHEKGPLENMVIYGQEEGLLHVFPANSSLWNLFVEYKKYVRMKLMYYQKIHLEI